MEQSGRKRRFFSPKDKFPTSSKGKVDGYIAARSYPGHPHFIITQLNYEYWKDLFTQTKPDDNNQHFRKGLIQINFHEK